MIDYEARAAIGNRVRLARIHASMTQHDLAVLLGVSYQQVCKYERGTNAISAERLVEIAKAVGVSPSQFFDEADDGVHVSRQFLEFGRAWRRLDERQRAALSSLVLSIVQEE